MNPERIIAIVVAIGLHAYLLYGWRPSPGAMAAMGDETGTEVQVELAESADAEETPPEPVPPEPVPPDPIPPEPEVPPEPVMAEETDPIPPPEPKPKPKPQPKPAPKPAKPKAPPGAKNTDTSAGAATGATGGTPGGSKDSSAPRWKNKVKPTYPTSARAARLEASVGLLINVSADGRPTGARVTRSSGHTMLDEAATRAAMSSTFFPTIRSGVAVADSVTTSYRFTLSD